MDTGYALGNEFKLMSNVFQKGFKVWNTFKVKINSKITYTKLAFL